MSPFLTVLQPAFHSGVLIDSPHSGQYLPDDFGYSCANDDVLLAQDIAVDQLIKPLVANGAYIICAEVARSYIDLNRAPDDIDPALCADRIATKPTNYSRLGIGLIHRDARPGKMIYKRRLTAAEIQARIRRLYHPYYQAVAEAIAAQPGEVLYLNAHSMASANAPTDAAGRPLDLVIGTGDGCCADRAIVENIAGLCRAAGLRVGIDHRYKGGHLIRTFGRPADGIHALQLEFNRSLYMNERTGELSNGASRITSLMAQIVDYWGVRSAVPLAAE